MSKVAEILSVGTELLLGNITNTNARYLSEKLADVGIDVYHQTVVGDNKARLIDAVKLAIKRSDLVITTGGLGPTTDDLTKQTIAEALGLPLVVDSESLARLESRMGDRMTENNKRQAMMPKGATVLQNDNGTAPGCYVEQGGKHIIMLPGPPHEMKAMFESRVLPVLKRLSGATTIHSKQLCFFGIGESELETKLGAITESQNPTVALYAKRGRVEIRVTSKAHTEAAAEEVIAPVISQIKEIVGEFLYSENGESLVDVAVNSLKSSKLRVVTAESCTGGMISEQITSIPGASDVIRCGFVTYSPGAKERYLKVEKRVMKKYGEVSAQTAALMAIGATMSTGSQLGVSITGLAGPESDGSGQPVGTIYIGVGNRKDVWVKKVDLSRYNMNRESIREIATLHALDLIRRYATPELRSTLDEICMKKKYLSLPSRNSFVLFLRSIFPWIGDSFSLILNKLILIGCLAAFVVSILFLYQNWQSEQDSIRNIENIESIYNAASQAQDGEEPERLDNGYLAKFEELYGQNEDIAGWISIEGLVDQHGTDFSYPVTQTDNNEFYLKANFDKQYDEYGIPFIDYRNNLTDEGLDGEYKSSDSNMIIYAHNMKYDDRMFGPIARYREDIDLLKEYPVISFDTVYEESDWKIIAGFYATADSSYDDFVGYHNYIRSSGEEETQAYLDEVMMRSIYDTGVDVTTDDQLLVLSTCVYEFDDARFVVVARKVREGEDSAVDSSKIVVNEDAVYPQQWYEAMGGTQPDVTFPYIEWRKEASNG